MRHRKYKTSARLFVQQNFSAEDTCPLPENQIHYLRNVLRLNVGAEVVVFNGKDGEWLAIITEISKKHAYIKFIEQLRPYRQVSDIWAIFSPIKKTRMDFMVEKATELGVSKLIPVQTDYCQNNRIKLSRIEAQVIEASEQCERLDVPDVVEIKPLREILDNWDKNRLLLVCAEKGETIPIMPLLTDVINKPIAIIVGPEGGFSDSEIQMLRSCEFVRMVDLGERILRTETAMTAALSCYQMLTR